MSENYSTVELIETAVNDFMTQYKKEVSNGFVLWYQDEVVAEVASELEKLAESER